ncbi:hypothetical protein DYB25_010153, partial [Aphanomyces astaci]
MPATSYVYEVPLFFLVLWRMVAVAAAADTAQCTALNQTYQSQYAICRNKSSTPYSSGREWCAVPSCADAIKAAAARRACGCEIELSCLPLSYCTDACLSDLEAYQSSHIACSEANQTLVVSSCAACQHMFPQYASFQASCQVQASSADAYVATFHNNLGAQFDYCIKQFPAAGLSFPTYELSSDHPSTSTLVPVILGVAAAVCVVAALGYVLYRRRQKPSREQGGMCRLDAASGTDLSRYQPDSSTALAAAAAGAPWLHAEGDKERSLTTLPLQDIRFDPDVAKYRIPKQSITDVTKLATGGFGIVFRAKVYGRDVAMKQLLPSKAKDLDATAVLTGHRYTTKADIYSFGAFLSEMDTLGTPYATETSTNCEGFSNARIAILVGIHCVSQGQLQPSFTHNMPPTLLALARQCLEFHGSERPSAAQVVAALE